MIFVFADVERPRVIHRLFNSIHNTEDMEIEREDPLIRRLLTTCFFITGPDEPKLVG